MSAFIARPNRDAFAVFRGFAFQVERTIAAWLTLDPGSVLLLEAGEDIDYVREIVDSGDGLHLEQRLTEQVKFRSRSVSLRSGDVTEAIASLLQHVDLNPSVQLKFRFLSNATPVKERGVAFPGDLSGIEWWERFRIGACLPEEVLVGLRAVRSVLLVAARRATSPSVSFLESASDEELASKLIERFEFSMEYSVADEPGSLVKRLLLDLGLAKTSSEANRLFPLLFHTVFVILSREGEKRLDESLLEQALRATVPPAEADRISELLAALGDVQAQLTDQADALGRIQQQTEQVAIERAVEAVAARLGFTLGPRLVDEKPSGPPPRPRLYAPPRQLLEPEFDQGAKWLAVQDLAGSGKTQFCRELFIEWEGPRAWVSLHGQSSEIRFRLDVAVTGLLDPEEARDVAYDRVSAMELIAAREPEPILVVLDDVPDLVLDRRAEDEILEFAGQVFGRLPIRVVSTSQFRLPASVERVLGDALQSLGAPQLGEADIRSLMEQAGAPQAMVASRLPELILDLGGSHPALGNAAVSWLALRGWHLGDEELGALLSGAALAETKQEARSKVRALVADPAARVLLDRLSLSSAPLRLELVDAVAQVPSPISQARERFHELVGPWISISDDEGYELTPLLRDVGRDYLTPEERRGVNVAIAESLLLKDALSVSDAFYVCKHLRAADDFARLAYLYLKFLLALAAENPRHTLSWPQYFFWVGEPWPDEVPRHLRLLIRAAQVAALAEDDAQPFEEDLEALLNEKWDGDDEALAVAFAQLQLLMGSRHSPPPLRARRAISAGRALRRANLLDDTQADIPAAELLWWSGAMNAQSGEEQRAVLATLADMTREEVRQTFEPVESASMAVLTFEWFYASPAVLDDGTPDWATTLYELESYQWLSEVDGCGYLRAIFARVRALILADYLHELGQAVKLLAPFEHSSDPVERFVGAWTAARILSSKREDTRALPYFEAALSVELDSSWTGHQFDCMSHAALASARADDLDRSRQWMLQALSFSTKGLVGDAFRAIDLLGELGLLHWRAGAPAKSVSAFMCAATRLRRLWSEDEAATRESLVKIGHVVGWINVLARTGEPPAVTQNGEPYIEPESGMMYRSIPDLSELQIPGGFGTFYLICGQIAAAAKIPALARWCYGEAMRAALHEGRRGMASVAAGRLATYEAISGNYRDATRHAMELAAVTSLTRHSGFDLFEAEPTAEADPDHQASALFYSVVWPVFVTALNVPTPQEALNLLGRLEAGSGDIFGQHCRQVMSDCRLAFSDPRSEDIRALIREADSKRLLVLYMAASRASDTPADIAASCHAATLTAEILGSSQEPLIQARLAEAIIRFWQEFVATRAFRLSHPEVLRMALEESDEGPAHARAARITQAAIVATGARLDDSLAAALAALVRRNG